MRSTRVPPGWLLSGLTALLCAAAAGCAEERILFPPDLGHEPFPSNPDARLQRHSLYVYPGACYDIEIDSVESPWDLRARGDEIASATTVVNSGIFAGAWLRVCGESVGTTQVALLDAYLPLDQVEVEVAAWESLVFMPVQNVFPDTYAPVRGAIGLLAGRGAFLYVVPASADGRVFDAFYQDYTHIAVDAAVAVTNDTGNAFQLESAAAGTYAVTLVGEPSGRTVDLVVVDPSAIESLEITSLVRRTGSVAYSVVGLTATGLRILGLDVELTVDGVVVPPRDGRWLFQSSAEGAAGAVVRATWNGLEATL
ncbi:MAG: hypothetical protein H6725_19150 [Sandaracinaceae bacterium]|nr:hypothetical protein [Sandaracinaceae bacterium]